MSKLTSIEDLLIHELKDLYSAETQLWKATPKLLKAATCEDLKACFESHLKETRVHIKRLEGIFLKLEISPRGRVCKATRGLVEEWEDVLKDHGDPIVRDAALIIAAQKAEHYEIASYGSVCALAKLLGWKDVGKILHMTLAEEVKSDKWLSDFAKKYQKHAPLEHA